MGLEVFSDGVASHILFIIITSTVQALIGCVLENGMRLIQVLGVYVWWWFKWWISEPDRAWHKLGKCSSTEIHAPSPDFFLTCKTSIVSQLICIYRILLPIFCLMKL